MKRIIATLLGLILIINIAACGIILHPERKGQVGGRLDLGIVVLDGLGLFFFVIPGIIAFAVDFSYGTIYLPGGKRANLTEKELDQISLNGKVDLDALSSVIKSKTNTDVSLKSKDLQVTYLQTINQLPASFTGSSLALMNSP